MKVIFLFVFGLFINDLAAQSYSLSGLSQSAVSKTKIPTAVMPKMSRDTTYTIYNNCSVEMTLYFVDGSGTYNNLFNPNPTGVYLNKKLFQFYCDPEKSFKQNISNFLDIYEFSYLGRNYLCFFHFREDCVGKDCRYKCYNLFDITDPNRIVQTSFSSIYEGSETFGDFNFDGVLDFVRVAPKLPETVTDKKQEDFFHMITVYTFRNGKAIPLKSSTGDSHYIWAQGDNEAMKFKVFQHDWVSPLKDSTGRECEPVAFMPPYIAFDPRDSHLYTTNGERIEKKGWSLMAGAFKDLEGAQQFASEMASRDFHEILIMTDQYSDEITFFVLVGNYDSQEKALQAKTTLKTRFEMNTKLKDLRGRY
jgi:SPOR domain